MTFKCNKGEFGAAVYVYDNCIMAFDQNTKVKFSVNGMAEYGGAVYSEAYSKILFDRSSSVTFDTNEVAIAGGALQCQTYSSVVFIRNAAVDFINNKARFGGAISIHQSKMKISMNSLVQFKQNLARRRSGAIHFDDNFFAKFDTKSSVMFHYNTAARYGGAIYSQLKQGNDSQILANTSTINFSNNTALVGDDVYMQVQLSCDETCLNNSVVGLQVMYNKLPRRLTLYDPATCVNATNYVMMTIRLYLVLIADQLSKEVIGLVLLMIKQQ